MLIDGDVLAWRAASAVQKTEQDAYGFVQPFANIMEGQAHIDNTLLRLTSDLGAAGIKVVLSDPTSSWRKELWPDYKANRKDIIRPLLVGRLLEYLRLQYGAHHWAGLEADDVLGILATDPNPGYPGKRIIVSSDKDLRCVPGWHHRIGRMGEESGPVVNEITPHMARMFHLAQTLAGDRIDGYYGCPGIGMTRAERILEEPTVLSPQKGIVTRGPRKGQETTKWTSAPTSDLWACIVSHYRKAGLTEEAALVSARLAYILQHGDFEVSTGKIRLWTPEEKLCGS